MSFLLSIVLQMLNRFQINLLLTHAMLVMFQKCDSALMQMSYFRHDFCSLLKFFIGMPRPPKPWEKAGSSSSATTPFKPWAIASSDGPAPLKPSARPRDIVSRNFSVNRSTVERHLPLRPWEQNHGNNHRGINFRHYLHLICKSILLIN